MSLVFDKDNYVPRRDPKPSTTQEEFEEFGVQQQEIRTFTSLSLQNNPIAENEDMETSATQEFIASYIQILLLLGTYGSSISRTYDISLNGTRIAFYSLNYVGGATSPTRIQERIDLPNIKIKKGDILRLDTTGGAPFPDEEGRISIVLAGFSL